MYSPYNGMIVEGIADLGKMLGNDKKEVKPGALAKENAPRKEVSGFHVSEQVEPAQSTTIHLKGRRNDLIIFDPNKEGEYDFSFDAMKFVADMLLNNMSAQANLRLVRAIIFGLHQGEVVNKRILDRVVLDLKKLKGVVKS